MNEKVRGKMKNKDIWRQSDLKGEKAMDSGSLKSLFEDGAELFKPLLAAKREHADASNRFSFFEVISDHYYRETFHSDVLFALLNPLTPEIGAITKGTFLKRFLELIDVPFNPQADYCVTEEDPEDVEESKGRVDISIVGNGYSILIENKINYAAWQKNQLARYIESERNRNPENSIHIVCLTLVPNPAQEPEIHKYSKKYSGIVGEIDRKAIPLKMLAASDTNEAGEKWLHKSLINLLDESMEYISDNASTRSAERTAFAFMEQYRNLLERLGGEKMEYDRKIEILEYLGNNAEESKLLSEILDDKDRLFAKYFTERYLAENPESRMKKETVAGYDDVYILKEFKNYKVYLWFSDRMIQIGIFFPDKEYGKTKESESRQLLNSVLKLNPQIHTIKGVEKYVRSNQVAWYYFCIAFNVKPLDEAYDDLKSFIEKYPSYFMEEI